MLRRIADLHDKRAWCLCGGLLLFFAVILPLLHLLVPEGSALHVPAYIVQTLGKFACFALVALALDLIWGFTGMLSLGQGVFFALGAYAMGMYLMRAIGTEGMYRSELPDFMVFLDWKELPWYWRGFDNFPFALTMALVVPGALAWLFGFFAFRSRIRGVYFSIITQAMTFALMLLFFRNETGFGGNNGLTDFKRIVGYSLQDSRTKVVLYVCTVVCLFAAYVASRYLVKSKAGRVLTAIRDAESKVMFCGYNPLNYKLFVWTFAAMLSGLAGALYAPQVGIVNPSEMEPSNSIEMAIWVAVGGRGTLGGAILGAGLVNGLKSYLTVAFPDAWLYALAALFVLVTLFLPQGIAGWLGTVSSRLRARTQQADARSVAAPEVEAHGSARAEKVVSIAATDGPLEAQGEG